MILVGDVLEKLKTLPDESVHCCVTSPPYWGLRDYKIEGQIGLEETPEAYVEKLGNVFDEVRRVLREDGVLFLNLGDTYNTKPHGFGDTSDPKNKSGRRRQGEEFVNRKPLLGLKHKDLIGIPWMVAFELRRRGWYLRADIIWAKSNPMPESVTDRPTKAHEYIFLFSKSDRYYYDHHAVKEPVAASQLGRVRNDVVGGSSHVERGQHSKGGTYARGARDNFKRIGSKRDQAIPGQAVGTHREDRADSTYALDVRNRRTVWGISTQPFRGAHFAVFPPEIPRICILAGSCEKGVCPRCSAPHKKMFKDTGAADPSYKGSSFSDGKTAVHQLERSSKVPRTLKAYAGWAPTCSCGVPGVVPATVLDPFHGSGTSGAVAEALGRSYIGIEINSDYVALYETRRAEVKKWMDKQAKKAVEPVPDWSEEEAFPEEMPEPMALDEKEAF